MNFKQKKAPSYLQYFKEKKDKINFWFKSSSQVYFACIASIIIFREYTLEHNLFEPLMYVAALSVPALAAWREIKKRMLVKEVDGLQFKEEFHQLFERAKPHMAGAAQQQAYLVFEKWKDHKGVSANALYEVINEMTKALAQNQETMTDYIESVYKRKSAQRLRGHNLLNFKKDFYIRFNMDSLNLEKIMGRSFLFVAIFLLSAIPTEVCSVYVGLLALNLLKMHKHNHLTHSLASEDFKKEFITIYLVSKAELNPHQHEQIKTTLSHWMQGMSVDASEVKKQIKMMEQSFANMKNGKLRIKEVEDYIASFSDDKVELEQQFIEMQKVDQGKNFKYKDWV